MTLYWIYSIPNWLFGVLCTVAFVLFGVLGTYLSRDFVKRVHREDHSHNDIVGYFLAAITVFYGVTLGLVAIGTWNNYSAIQDKVDHEAQNVASLYRDVSSYPEPVRSELRQDLKDYVLEVIDHSWPQQRRGLVPSGSGVFIDHLQEHMLQYSPQTSGQQVIYQESYHQFNELVESRRARLDSVTTSLPRSMWWMVILGALVSITTTMFFDLRSFSMHVWMTALMSGLLGLMIFLIATLDNPFRGKVSVSPVALERVYSQLIK
ncbi:Protein of unknown function [Terriglobus roseus]|uniref:DUF4239 domain-containing protein n=2 Tax=Terriglobus roseus TaxID=392734 RepID=A0A1H4PSY6_9BACT|nr:Protein of unknown function [Terriglobus roseus]